MTTNFDPDVLRRAGARDSPLRSRPYCVLCLAALVGKDTVSRVWRKVKSDWEAWNARSLVDEPIVRLILDGTVVRVCRNGLKRPADTSTDSLPRYPITGIACCCACAASGHAAAAPPRRLMNSRRRTNPSSGVSIVSAPKSTLIGLEIGTKTIAAVHSQCR
jgi:hypothetical protein